MNMSNDGDFDALLSTTATLQQQQQPQPSSFVNPVVDYQRHSAQCYLAGCVNDSSVSATITSKVLILYTGGTVGMKSCSQQVCLDVYIYIDIYIYKCMNSVYKARESGIKKKNS